MSEAEFRPRLTERCQLAGVLPAEDAFARLWTYYDLLRRWNRRINLTALPLDGYPSESLDRLVVEPLIAASALPVDLRGRWVDLGSGGGSPAIPLKIVRPELKLTMTESRHRKAAFLREAIRAVGLEGADTLGERFEVLASQPPGSFVLVTIRAVRIDEPLNILVAHLLASGGTLVSFGTAIPELPQGFHATKRTEAIRGIHVFERA